MLTAGDLIDNTLGVKFGLATLTAAACGQVVRNTGNSTFRLVVTARRGPVSDIVRHLSTSVHTIDVSLANCTKGQRRVRRLFRRDGGGFGDEDGVAYPRPYVETAGASGVEAGGDVGGSKRRDRGLRARDGYTPLHGHNPRGT